MPEFIFRKDDGKLKLVGQGVGEFARWVCEAENGEHFRGEFKSLGSSKSQQQLGYYYAGIVPDVIRGLKERGQDDVGFIWIAGTHVPLGLTVDNVDRFLKVLYATSMGIDGKVSKARMSIEEMSEFIEFVLGWAHHNKIGIRPPRERL